MATSNASAEERYELIIRGLGEVLGGEKIKAILEEGRVPKGYWGAHASLYRSVGILKIVRRYCYYRKTYAIMSSVKSGLITG